MPAVTDVAAPPQSESFGVPPVDVSALYVPTTAYVVSGLTQSERVRPRDGLQIPMIVVSFTVPGHVGVWTIGIDNYAFTHADVTEYMRERAYQIKRVFALPDSTPPYADVATPPAVPIADLLAAAEQNAEAYLADPQAAIAALLASAPPTTDVRDLLPPPPP